jgi:hypothetical protein
VGRPAFPCHTPGCRRSWPTFRGAAAPPSWIQFTIDQVVFADVAALCLGSAIACGLVPAWQASRLHLVAALNDAGRGDTGSRHRR